MAIEADYSLTDNAAWRDVAAELPPLSLTRPREPVPRRLPARRHAIRRLACADVLSVVIGLVTLSLLSGQRIPAVTLVMLPLTLLLASFGGRYDRDELTLRKSTLDELPALLGLAGAGAVGWSLIAWAADIDLGLPGGGAFLFWISMSVALVLTRAGARRLTAMAAPLERVLIVGSSASRELLANSLSTDPGARMEVVGYLPLEDERRGHAGAWPGPDRRRRSNTFDDLESVVHELDVDRVFLIPTSADGELVLEAVRRTSRLGVKVSLVPRLFEVVGSSVAFDMVGGVTLLGVRQPGLRPAARMCKRAMDIVSSGICLIILSPLMIGIAIAIKLDTPGSVFFRQQRMGRDNEVFEILKFRSMVVGAEDLRKSLEELNETTGLFKMAQDPRITRVGRLLRGSSLDELPQLINVLMGDMSLVGPRPLVLHEDRLVEGRHRDRLHLAPGITGPWQVLGPVRPPLSEMVKTDYLYAVNWSIWSDVKLLVRTAAHVAGRRGL